MVYIRYCLSANSKWFKLCTAFAIITILYLSFCSNMQKTILNFFPDLNNDASQVKWAHAVNSLDKLHSALKSNSVFFECDVMLLDSQHGPELMLAHPPETSSDLSLDNLLSIYKNAFDSKVIGLKLDFKHGSAVESGLELLLQYGLSSYPVIINADILKSEKDQCYSCDVRDWRQFLHAYFRYNPGSWSLSVGWSTANTIDGYTWRDVIRMHEVIHRSQIEAGVNDFIKSDVTFPVRESKIHGASMRQLLWLVSVYGSSLTIFSSSDSTRIVESKRTILTLMKLLTPAQIYFDLGNYNDSELEEMKQLRDKGGISSHFRSFDETLWKLECEDKTSIMANQGGCVFSGESVASIKYHKGLNFHQNSQITAELFVQFITFSSQLSKSILKICLYASDDADCLIDFQLDSTKGVSIGSIQPDFEHIYQLNLTYKLDGDCSMDVVPSTVTNSGSHPIPRQEYRITKHCQVQSDRTYHFSVTISNQSKNDKFVIETISLS